MPNPKEPPRSILSNAGAPAPDDVVSWLTKGRQEEAEQKKLLRKFKRASAREQAQGAPSAEKAEALARWGREQKEAGEAETGEKAAEESSPAPATPAPLSPAEQFRALLEYAWTGSDPVLQAQKAREALALRPDDAEPPALLAFFGEGGETREARIETLARATATADTGLAPDAFAGRPRHAWARADVRLWVRLKFALAGLLWESGRRDEAVAAAHEILTRNIADDLGVRHVLALWLFDFGRDDDLEALWKTYYETDTVRAYTRVLLAFRRHGDGPDCRRHLKQAVKSNPRVPAFLCGQKPLPAQMPPRTNANYWEYDAVRYVAENGARWGNVPGAMEWIGQFVKRPAVTRAQRRFEAEWEAACRPKPPTVAPQKSA